jgi:eukaryotic-like serine/threonine-protein kinase
LHAQFAKDPDFVNMFTDEARLAARIVHPNVVPMLDVIVLEGELFLVMDYVEGEPFSRVLRAADERGQRVPLPIVASILAGTLHGLHAAHEAGSDRGEPLGIVHRDVSPHNILVGTDGVPRLLDFGIAKAAGRLHTTREGQLKGKLPYMAPEQVRGSADRLSDVYSCGVVLWEALAGKRLFKGDEANVLAAVLNDVVEPPSRYAPEVPAALDALTLRALNGDPKQRFASARQMAEALEQATALASASSVRQWLEELCAASLAERRRQVSAMDDSSPQVAPEQDGPSPSARLARPALLSLLGAVTVGLLAWIFVASAMPPKLEVTPESSASRAKDAEAVGALDPQPRSAASARTEAPVASPVHRGRGAAGVPNGPSTVRSAKTPTQRRLEQVIDSRR